MCLVKFRFVLYVFIIELLSKGRKFFKRGLRSAGLNYRYFRKEKQMLKTKSIALNINTIKGNKQKHKINLRYSLLTSTEHESHERSVYFYFLVMAQCFVVFVDFLYFWRIFWNNHLTPTAKHSTDKRFMRGKS